MSPLLAVYRFFHDHIIARSVLFWFFASIDFFLWVFDLTIGRIRLFEVSGVLAHLPVSVFHMFCPKRFLDSKATHGPAHVRLATSVCSPKQQILRSVDAIWATLMCRSDAQDIFLWAQTCERLYGSLGTARLFPAFAHVWNSFWTTCCCGKCEESSDVRWFRFWAFDCKARKQTLIDSCYFVVQAWKRFVKGSRDVSVQPVVCVFRPLYLIQVAMVSKWVCCVWSILYRESCRVKQRPVRTFCLVLDETGKRVFFMFWLCVLWL